MASSGGLHGMWERLDAWRGVAVSECGRDGGRGLQEGSCAVGGMGEEGSCAVGGMGGGGFVCCGRDGGRGLQEGSCAVGGMGGGGFRRVRVLWEGWGEGASGGFVCCGRDGGRGLQEGSCAMGVYSLFH